jgi:hypothetical protein
MNKVSWNFIGLGISLKEQEMIDLLKYEKPTILLLHQAKLEALDMLRVSKFHWK